MPYSFAIATQASGVDVAVGVMVGIGVKVDVAFGTGVVVGTSVDGAHDAKKKRSDRNR
jgi:hypothetical protein